MNLLYLFACQCPAAADSTKVCLHSAASSEAFLDVFSPLTAAVQRICGWVVLLLALYFVLKYVVTPLIANCHEKKIKRINHKYEESWNALKTVNKQKEKIELLENKLKTMETDAMAEMEGRHTTEKKEFEKTLILKNKEIELLKEQIKLYQNALSDLNVELKSK